MTTRDQALERLRSDEFDVLVVGGGITGAGVALDATVRGLRAGLVERDDYASGTSSRSSKLVHGGLRYLQHLELGLVREALAERGVLQRIVPFLVWPTPFIVPRYGKRRQLAIRAGLDAYDVLAIGSGFPRHRRLDPGDVHRLAPALRPDSGGGLQYWDARTDDARLTWTIARTAMEHGAAMANHTEVVGLLRSGPEIRGRGPSGRVAGAHVVDTISGESFDVRARVVVNASGVWADAVMRMGGPDATPGIRPSKGIHIVFPASRVPLSAALTIPAPDGRYIFCIPYADAEGHVLVGTTDEDYAGPVDAPRAHPDEIAFLIDTLNRVLDDPVSQDDMLASYAGLRPLIQNPGQPSKDLSRRHKVIVSDDGLVTITGGKLTTYRRMARDAVDAALDAGRFGRFPRSRSSQTHLAGGQPAPGLVEALAARAAEAGIDPMGVPRLYHRYGSRAADVVDLVVRNPSLGEPLHPALPYLRAEAAYAVSDESAERPDDVLSRRLRLRVTSADRGVAALDWIVDLLARHRGWDPARRDRERQAYSHDVAADAAAERDG
jgi:glycerol-3-phosphate dehydrogenase